MEEHQLKELAYTIFFGACGKRSNAEHVQVMRAQLEVSSCANSSIHKHMSLVVPVTSHLKVFQDVNRH